MSDGLTNTNTVVTVTVDGIAAGGDFSQTNDCGPTLAPGASCAVTVTFTPTAPGGRSGTLTLSTGATNTPIHVALSGSGFGI